MSDANQATNQGQQGTGEGPGNNIQIPSSQEELQKLLQSETDRRVTQAIQTARTKCSVEKILEFDDVTKYVKNGKEQSIDKIRVAKEIASQPTDYTVLDLAKKMDELTLFIRSANGLLPVKESD